MKKDILEAVLLICVLVLCIGILLVLATGLEDDDKEKEISAHTHNEYVEKAGDTMTGDLVVVNLHVDETIFGDGSALTDLNASLISTGTVDIARLPANIDADTIDNLDSTAFALAVHDHDDSYYTKTESDAKYAVVGHTHPSTGDADTLDGLDSTYFANISHNHDSLYYPRADVDSNFLGLSGGILTGDLYLPNLYSTGIISGDASGLWGLNASRINTGTIAAARLPSNINADTLDGLDSLDFAMAVHDHDARYYQKSELYQKSEVDANFLSLGGGTLTGDLSLPNLYASGIISGDGGTLTNLNASAITSGTIGIARLPANINADTLDGLDSVDFAMALHTHNATHITEGELAEARLPQNAIDDSEIEAGFGLVPSGSIVMWNGTMIPNGWALCDGTNGTPDLRGMFIVGYDPNDTDYNSTGLTGGEKAHTLTVSEIPSHRHSYSGSTSTDPGHTHPYQDLYWEIDDSGYFVDENDPLSTDDNGYLTLNRNTGTSGSHSHTYSGDTSFQGGGAAHENRPPYYVLAFIMKL
jgi:microcystin-dependent protein